MNANMLALTSTGSRYTRAPATVEAPHPIRYSIVRREALPDPQAIGPSTGVAPPSELPHSAPGRGKARHETDPKSDVVSILSESAVELSGWAMFTIRFVTEEFAPGQTVL